MVSKVTESLRRFALCHTLKQTHVTLKKKQILTYIIHLFWQVSKAKQSENSEGASTSRRLTRSSKVRTQFIFKSSKK